MQKQNDAYKTNLANLEQLILVKFAADSMVVPRDSSVDANYSSFVQLLFSGLDSMPRRTSTP